MFVLLLALTAADPVQVSIAPFGTSKTGAEVRAVTMTAESGFSVRILTLGVTIQSMMTPASNGQLADVVLGFDTVEEYEGPRNPYFGCVVGRYANRIAGAKFTLDGQRHNVTANVAGKHHIHGGGDGALSKVVWDVESSVDDAGNGVAVFTHTSPDGSEGFPGTLDVTVTATMLADGNTLGLEYTATTDKPTVLNLTNHSYFNLHGHDGPPVLDHKVTIPASRFPAVDRERMSTGELVNVAGTPFDFRKGRFLGAGIDQTSAMGFNGYDQSFQFDPPDRDWARANPELAKYRTVDVQVGRSPSRRMLVTTTEPAVQLYTCNMRPLEGKDGATYAGRCAFCLETQHHPNSPNIPAFPSTVLRPGQTFYSLTSFEFSDID